MKSSLCVAAVFSLCYFPQPVYASPVDVVASTHNVLNGVIAMCIYFLGIVLFSRMTGISFASDLFENHNISVAIVLLGFLVGFSGFLAPIFSL